MVTKQQASELTEYTYDTENRLVKVEKNSATLADFEYDGDGGRTKNVDASGTTKYVGSLYEERGGVGTSYIFFGDTRIASVTNGGVRYYHADHLGGTNVLSDSLGEKKELIEYLPFGEINQATHQQYGSSAEIAHFYFTGKELDDSTGLYYYGARYYDSSLGRFITADDIIQTPTDPQTLNRYSYTSNNSVNRIDPDGHFWKSIKNFFKKFGDWIFPGLGAATRGEWAIAGQGILSTIGGFFASPLFTVASIFQGGAIAAGSMPGTTWGNISKGLGYAAWGITAGYTAWNISIGVKNWAYEPRFKIIGLHSNLTRINDGDKVFVNGILNDEKAAIENAIKVGAKKIAYNPTDSAIADITESFLQKVTFTSSIDRQLADAVVGLKHIALIGHSQGAIAISNSLVNLGLRDQREAVETVRYINTQISQPRAFLSAAIGGASHVNYGNNTWDPSNVAGPNINPVKFASGVIGMAGGGFGVNYHGIQ